MFTKEYEEISQLIEQYDEIVIHRHIRPDPDALGAQLGLAALLTYHYPNKRVWTVGEDNEGLHFMGTMNKEGAYQSNETLAIIVDTPIKSRIDDQRFEKAQALIKMDHHPEDETFGTVSIVNTNASSASEMIADLSFYLQERLPMNNDAARLLYTGIIGDTGRFLYASTTVHTFEIAAWLHQFDFSAVDVAQALNTQPLEAAKLAGYVYQNLEMNEEGVAWIVLIQSLQKEFGLTDMQTAGVVSLPGTIEGVLCWAIFVQKEDGIYRCRLRSKGPVINELAKKHNGGGHPLASGADAHDEVEIQTIINELTDIAKAWN